MIAKLYHCQQDKLKHWKSAISFLYQKREMLYLYYICLGEYYITAISFWKFKTTERRITAMLLCRKAIWQDILFTCFFVGSSSAPVEYSRPVTFCPERSYLLSPRRLRAKYTHRTNQRFVLCVFRPAGGLPP